MLANFILSVQAVLPLFLLLMLGYFIRLRSWLKASDIRRFNSVIFKTLFPFTVFSSIHKTDLRLSFSPALLLFCVAAILLVYFLSLPFVLHVEKADPSRGAMIQAIYRSNFVLLGLPLVSNLFADPDLGMAALAIAVVIPVYNILAVITLERFRGGAVRPRRILKGVLTNPLILGCLAGLLCLPFSLPAPVDLVISQLADAASPMALLLLGASFRRERHPRYRRNLLLCCFARLLVVPGLCLTAGALLGFREMAFAVLLGVFASPCAVSSFTMALEMDSDGPLAGACVIYTSFFACFTMCLWIFLFKQLGVV